MTRQPVFVMTIGSTGSSAFMAMLWRCGMWLGECLPEESKPQVESQWFYLQNREMLAEDRLEWSLLNDDERMRIDAQWEYLRLNTYDRIRDEGYTEGDVYGFKDPRLCATASAWYTAFPAARWIVLTRSIDQISKGSQGITQEMAGVRLHQMTRHVRHFLLSRTPLLMLDYDNVIDMFPSVCSFCGLNPSPVQLAEALGMWEPRTKT